MRSCTRWSRRHPAPGPPRTCGTSALERTAGLRNGDVLQPLPILDAFDAIAYVDEVTPWHTWIDEDGLA